MEKFENDLGIINEKVKDLFEGTSLIKFSYAGNYILEFDLPQSRYGFNFFYVDIGTCPVIFNISETGPLKKEFSIKDFLLLWSKNVKSASIDSELNLLIVFENDFCCRIPSSLFDPEGLFDMRWSIYQDKIIPSFNLNVTDENQIYLQLP